MLLSRCDQRTTTKDWATGLKLPGFDEQSRSDKARFGGVASYFVDEADSATASKPKYRTVELSLKKLLAISYVTDELLSDSDLLSVVTVKEAFRSGNGV